MRRRPPLLPSHDLGHDWTYNAPIAPTGPFRWAAAVFGPLLLAGCLISPLPNAPAEEDSGTLAEPAAPRSKPASESRKVPACTRVWNVALADSTWKCPDPRPPAPDFGGSP